MLGTILWILLIISLFAQPVVAGQRVMAARRGAIEAVRRATGGAVITMIHREEAQNVFGNRVARYIDIEDAQTIIPAIEQTPKDQPINLILHTPGGLVLAAMQIARALKAHPAKVTVYVPIMAMSGGTLIALAADEIVMGEFSALGPIDPQLSGLPAASILAAKREKPVDRVSDLTLIFADMSEKSIRQVVDGATDLMRDRLGEEAASRIAQQLATGAWTHDYVITAEHARALGLTVQTGLPPEVLNLMRYYEQPVRRAPSIDFAPAQPVSPRDRELF